MDEQTPLTKHEIKSTTTQASTEQKAQLSPRTRGETERQK